MTTGLKFSFESDKPGDDDYFEKVDLNLVWRINEDGNLVWLLPQVQETAKFLRAIQSHLDELRDLGAEIEFERRVRYESYSDLELHEEIHQSEIEAQQSLASQDEEWAIHLEVTASHGASFGYVSTGGWFPDGGTRIGELLNIYFDWHWAKLRSALGVVRYVPPIREIPGILEELSPDFETSRLEVSKWLEKITSGRFSYVEKLLSHEGFGSQSQSVSRYVLDNSNNSVAVRFQDVGVGLSQVIPILQALFNKYRGLRSQSLLMLEQPELHLHPRMQSNLMDAIVSSLKSGNHWQQILLETHSESMVMRLQKLIGSGQVDPDSISILYVDSAQANKDGDLVRRLHVDEAGQLIEPWPESFAQIRLEELGFGGKST